MANPVKRLVKPNEVRGTVLDKIAGAFGDSVLGMYDGGLRIEILDKEGNVVQFTVKPVIHKALVSAEECDPLVPIDTQMKEYEAALAARGAKKDTKAAPAKDKDVQASDNAAPIVTTTPCLEVSEEDKAKLNALADSLKNSNLF